MQEPVTRYARRGGVHIAYQVLGNGPHDLVLVSNWLTNLEANWGIPNFPGFLRGLGSFSRCITFDQVGSGVPDRRGGHGQTLESWAEDLRSVLDAVGSEKATICCFDAGGAPGIFFAATYPEQVENLMLMNCYARFVRAPDYPAGMPEERIGRYFELTSGVWGGMTTLSVTAPSVAHDEEIVSRWAKYERIVLSPGDMKEVFDLQLGIDVRDILSSVRVPTLVLHSKGNGYILPSHGSYLTDHIAESKYVEIDSQDHFFFLGNSLRPFLGEIEEFVTGSRPAIVSNRTLTTLLFTDIVSSTEHAAKIGDDRWRELLDRHDILMREVVSRYSGRSVKHTGDGFLATFDGPARAVTCAKESTRELSKLGVEIRAGLHTGEVEVGERTSLAWQSTSRLASWTKPLRPRPWCLVRSRILSSVPVLNSTTGDRSSLRGSRVSGPCIAPWSPPKVNASNVVESAVVALCRSQGQFVSSFDVVIPRWNAHPIIEPRRM
ncbi:MAG TPA: alpha/beta fold hydrolase, partial [Actinomycetota bacterium]|nr:alpha/beta fold hydrolase [Actinomycetota bacterium]